MNDAEYIVDVLLENIDSLEGVPNYDEFLTKAIREPNSEEGRHYRLKNWPPKSKAEAKHMGVNWFIKGGRKYTFSQATEHPETFYNSRTMATNRNARRKSFGYRDTYSMRERGWPTAYRKPDSTERYPWRSPEQTQFEI